MNLRPLQLVCVLLLAGNRLGAALSTWDEVQLHLLEQYSTPLRWDNVEGAPYWIEGPKPRHYFRTGLHLINLQAGEAVTLRAEANTWLRLVGDGRTLRPGDLEIGVSTDARMFIQASPIATVDPYALLIKMPPDKPSFVRVQRPANSESNVVFAAFFSRVEPFITLLPHRETVRLPGKPIRLGQEDQAAAQRVLALTPDKEVEFAVQGSARLQLVAQLPWPRSEPAREQSLLLHLSLNGADPAPLWLSPELDSHHRARVKGAAELVSYRMNGFFSVPEGEHQVRLQVSTPIYLSVFRQSQPDFLLPSLNGPRTNTIPQAPSGGKPSLDLSTAASKLTATRWNAADLVALEQQARQLARDNQPLDAGGQAADFLNRLAQSQPDYPAAQRTADALWRQRTFYREVLPSSLRDGCPLRKMLFTPLRLETPFAQEQRTAVFNPTREQVEGMLAEGHFAALPPRMSPGLLYELPPRAHDSELRLAVMADTTNRVQLLVQFDQEAPIKVVLDAANQHRQAQEGAGLAASDAWATLRVLEQEARWPAGLAMNLPLGEFDLPLPVVEPGVIELPLPQRVRQVRVLLQEATGPVLTSVAYRAAKPFQLGEEGYLSLLDQAGAAAAMQALAQTQETPEPASESVRELRNQLLPLARLLQAHYNEFAKSIDSRSMPPRVESPLESGTAGRLKDSARSLERDGHCIEAVEMWSRLFWEGSAVDQSEAALAIMRCLEALGEESLASQYARFIVLRSSGSPREIFTGSPGSVFLRAISRGEQIPAPAVALLERTGYQTGDLEQLEQLHAVLFRRCPCPEHLSGLAAALASNGQDELALSAGLILPREMRPAELLLAAALHRNWWQTFDQLADQLPNSEAKSFWRAQKHLAFHDFVAAEQELKQANACGREMLQALQRGLQIRGQLSAGELGKRWEALLAWEQWQAEQPGPKTWRTAQDVLQISSATELIFNSEQNRFVSYLRAEPGKPAKLRFLGPLRLQVEARPILGVPYTEPADDWLQIVEYGITNRMSVSQCVPNPNLRFTASRTGLVGLKTAATLAWGPGWHEMEVSLASHAALIRVLEEEPVLPTRVLPTLNAERMNLVLHGDLKPVPVKGRIRAERESGIWWVPSELAQPSGLFDAMNPRALASTTSTGIALAGLDRLRLALRSETEPGRSFEYDTEWFRRLPAAEQWLAAARAKRWNDFTNWSDLPEAAQVRGWLATGRIQQLLESSAPGDMFERLNALVEVAEHYPTWREQAQCLAESLATGTNCPPGGRKMLAGLTRDRTWVPLKVSPTSAGMRPVQVSSDLPQDPFTRLRRALLPPGRTNEFTVSGQGAFTASLALQHPARVELQAQLVKAGFSPVLPLAISMQVDDLEVQHLSLSPAQLEAGTNFMLSTGSHLLRVWVDDPVVNQFVRVRLSGSSESPTNALWSKPLAEAASERRFFHVATRAQPVRFTWKGPALLRVDEWRDNRLVSQLRLVPAGEQTIEIPPASGRPESWYQVFVRDTQTNQVLPRLASVIREPEEVPPPRLRLPETTPPAQAQLTDYYNLGGQEDGTWTPSVLWVQRRPFEISDLQESVENEFLEANIAYRKANPGETLWFKTEALGRWHRPGDLTFGLSERVEGHPQDSPFDWTWLGEGFVGTVGPDQQDVQWSLFTELELGKRYRLNRKLDWYPFAGLFGRYLSTDSGEASRYDYIDQDLYTSFKDEHRWGGVLGNEIEYQPWLDTVWKGGVYLRSNENFSPDDWGLRFSWSQLLGNFRGEAAYQFRYFLKDSDRSSSSSLQGVSAGLYAERWLNGRHRVELGVQFRHDWPDSGDSYFFVLRWDFSQGRCYRDYAPHEMGFRDLRSRRLSPGFNNRLQPGAPVPRLP